MAQDTKHWLSSELLSSVYHEADTVNSINRLGFGDHNAVSSARFARWAVVELQVDLAALLEAKVEMLSSEVGVEVQAMTVRFPDNLGVSNEFKFKEKLAVTFMEFPMFKMNFRCSKLFGFIRTDNCVERQW